MSWTDERVERLKTLWADGRSASQIAAELGEVTRNAVIGKVHRLGLSGRVKAAAAPVRARKERRPSPAASPAAVVVGAVVMKPRAELAPVEAPRPTAIEVPESGRATILTLTERSCKWPIGDPGRSDFFFCGRASEPGAPYCQHHSRVAYQPVQNRNRDRKRA